MSSIRESALRHPVAWLAFVGAPLAAQAIAPSEAARTYRPTRLGTEQRIEVDAVFSEPVWAEVPALSPLTQVVPVEGAIPGQRTEVRLVYDADFLYVALDCRDDPAVVRGNLMARDANLDPDDRVELWFDTFHDRRFGYWFQIGPGGSQGDALLSDAGRNFNKAWDGIWYGRARRTERGWQAELALPFKTLAFRPDGDSWGFNLRRLRKEDQSESRWASPTVAYRFFDLTVGGELVGMQGLEQGIGLDVIPYVRASSGRDRRERDDFSSAGDWGLDVNYRITPSLNFRLTYNTDFAETEVDARQVNLTRFPLFFPERRDFFLEDAGLFEFGAPARRSDTLPYFSRRIGLDPNTREPVPILFGARLTGRVDGWNLGLLQSVIDERPGQPEEGLGVVRISRNLGAESSVGMIYTGGDPAARGYASTQGADLKLRDSELFGPGRLGSLWAYFMNTQADDGDGNSYGLQARFQGREWEHDAQVHHVDDGFDPKLGFVQRSGINRYRLDSSYTWRPNDGGWLRRVNVSLRPTLTTLDEGNTDSWAVPLRWLSLTGDSEDSIQFETHRIFERIRRPFGLGGGAVTILPGDYGQTRHFATLRFSDQRPLSGRIEAQYGDFYDGTITRVGYDAQLVASRFWQVSGGYDKVFVDLSGGSFTTEVTEGRLDLQLDPFVSVQNLVQYDTQSKALTAQSRLRWIFEPGRELFLVGLYGWERELAGGALVPTNQDVIVKLVYTLRF